MWLMLVKAYFENDNLFLNLVKQFKISKSNRFKFNNRRGEKRKKKQHLTIICRLLDNKATYKLKIKQNMKIIEQKPKKLPPGQTLCVFISLMRKKVC